MIALEAHRIKGAAHIWFGHNHPSGSHELSPADRRVAEMANNLFNGSGIKPHGILAIGGGDVNGDRPYMHTDETGMDTVGITPSVSPNPTNVPVIERQFTQHGTLGARLTGPNDAIQMAQTFAGGSSGLLLLDTQFAPVGYFPMDFSKADKFRDTGQVQSIARALSMSNAINAMAVDQNGELSRARAENLGAVLSAHQVDLIDAINLQTNKSMALSPRGLPSFGNVFNQHLGDLGLYSALSRGVEGLTVESAKPERWINLVKKLPGVKAEEIKWSGIEDWLKLQKGDVTRDQVSQYLAENGVQIEEVSDKKNDELTDEQRQKVRENTAQEARMLFALRSPNQTDNMDFYNAIERWQSSTPGSTLHSQSEALIDELLRKSGAGVTVSGLLETEEENLREGLPQSTQYETYTLHEGKNYREVRLTLPNAKQPSPKGRGMFVFGDEGSLEDFLTDVSSSGYEHLDYGAIEGPSGNRDTVEFEGLTPDQANDFENMARGYGAQTIYADNEGNSQAPQFSSNHWKEPNVLAHFRLTDRFDAEGRRVLFIEEIQSDWAQQARKKGFEPEGKEKEELEAKGRRYDELNNKVAEYDEADRKLTRNDLDAFKQEDGTWALRSSSSGKIYTPDQISKSFEGAFKTVVDMHDSIQSMRDEQTQLTDLFMQQKWGKVPRAPFVTDTKSWVNLAMKRILVMAAQEGYDRVALISGQDSADRYGLEKHIYKIDFWPHISPGAEGLYGYDAFPRGGGSPIEQRMQTREQLEAALGKEIADQIVNAQNMTTEFMGQPKSRKGTLFSSDLKVGGEGMKSFYDKFAPAVLQSLVKPYGVQVGSDSFPFHSVVRDPAQARTVDITPEMRQDITNNGLPLMQGEGKRGSYDPVSMTIGLLKKADASTFPHEAGHHFLNMLSQLAERPDAPADIKQDMQTLLDWFGVQPKEGMDSLGTWNGMSLDEQREGHEKFARGFEQYLREGNAPSEKLRGIFERFKNWLLDIYKSAKKLGVELSPGVRKVYDNMFANAKETADERQFANGVDKLRFNDELRAGFEDLKNQTGWAETGGRQLRGESPAEVQAMNFKQMEDYRNGGATQWIPNSYWWAGRPYGYSESETHDIIDKALRGDKLGPKANSYVNWLVEMLEAGHTTSREMRFADEDVNREVERLKGDEANVERWRQRLPEGADLEQFFRERAVSNLEQQAGPEETQASSQNDQAALEQKADGAMQALGDRHDMMIPGPDGKLVSAFDSFWQSTQEAQMGEQEIPLAVKAATECAARRGA